MAVELRAPLFVQQGRYDALDLRTMIGGTRGAHVGVAGPTALLVEKVDNPTPRVSVGAGSVWLPDDVAVSHKGAVHFANLDAGIQLQCSTPSRARPPVPTWSWRSPTPTRHRPGPC